MPNEEWNEAKPPEGFYVKSGYGVFERQPYVEILLYLGKDVTTTQVTPDAAREIARNLFAAAEGAEMDGVLVKFLEERLNQDLETAAVILQDFRNLREGREGDGGGKTGS